MSFQLDVFLNDRIGSTYYDWFYFQYSLDGGTTWINPVALSAATNGSGVNMSAYPPLSIAGSPNNRFGWTGSLGTVNASYNIAASSTTRFRFIFESDGSVNTQGAATIYYVDVLSFGAVCNAPLPIELAYFGCETMQDCISVSWSTASETNNMEFQLWRSTDAMNWVKILTKPGAGTTTTPHEYWYRDYFPAGGTYYYRLTQVDYDGTETSHDISSCTFVENAGLSIAYYNVVGQAVNIQDAVAGMYIKEVRRGDAVARVVIYKQ